jgi:hypothetical protein
MLAAGGGGALGIAKMAGAFAPGAAATVTERVEQRFEDQEFDVTIEEVGHGGPLKTEVQPNP